MEAFAQRYYECNPHVYATAGKLNKKKQNQNTKVIKHVIFVINRSVLYCIICYNYVKYITAQ